jgi:alpha-amylase/alpha-mannosidase (GH57 family)
MEAVPPTQRLDQLHSGSWINQDFKIWIGHQEDNRGWDLLQHTRARLVELTPKAATGSGGMAMISTPTTNRNSIGCSARTCATSGLMPG